MCVCVCVCEREREREREDMWVQYTCYLLSVEERERKLEMSSQDILQERG